MTSAPGSELVEWKGLSETIFVKGFEIRNPLAYVTSAGNCTEPSAINANLATSPQSFIEPLDYWPSFQQLTPGQRYEYLHWLAAERRERPAEIGYAFLFFYGLERRALEDKQDAWIIFNEVKRLREQHLSSGGNVSRSFL